MDLDTQINVVLMCVCVCSRKYVNELKFAHMFEIYSNNKVSEPYWFGIQIHVFISLAIWIKCEKSCMYVGS